MRKEMLGKEMLDQERDEPKRWCLEPLQSLKENGIALQEKLGILQQENIALQEKLGIVLQEKPGIALQEKLGFAPLQCLEERGLPALQRSEELGITPLQVQRLEKLGITPLQCLEKLGLTPLQPLEELGITPAFLGSHPKLDCFWVVPYDDKGIDRFPQLSSHPEPGCLGGFFSSLDKFLQRIIPGYQQTKKVEEQSWRLAQLNILPEVRSQGHFKTCVFFAVIGAVEGRYRLHVIRNNPDNATVPQLSVQDAIDGIKQVPIDPAECFNWIIKQGLVPEFDCPYIGVPQGGHVLKVGRLSVVNGYRFINPGGECAEGIVKEIMEGGPIVGIISYQSEYLHAVMLIGGVYKDDRVVEYVIQNSWGTGWEEDGRGLVPISYLVQAYVPVLG